ncbi:hypothetical protein PS676_05035 [Pseudomonas fluorescens]|nr:hypothetical protein PS676_05035 [Pseudomonas fluorescens]
MRQSLDYRHREQARSHRGIGFEHKCCVNRRSNVGASLLAMRPDRSVEISDQLNSSPTGYLLAFKLSLILRKCGWKSTPRRNVMPVASTSSTVN